MFATGVHVALGQCQTLPRKIVVCVGYCSILIDANDSALRGAIGVCKVCWSLGVLLISCFIDAK